MMNGDENDKPKLFGVVNIRNDSLENTKECASLQSTARYEPKITYTTLHLPKDTRNKQEKICDKFLMFVHATYMFGVEDAVGFCFGQVPEFHDPNCEICKTRETFLNMLESSDVLFEEKILETKLMVNKFSKWFRNRKAENETKEVNHD